MARILSRSVFDWLKQGGRNLPLLCLFLPLYPLPQQGIFMRVMQMQVFQGLAVFMLLASKSFYRNPFLSPARLFALFSFLFILISRDTSPEFIFNLQMVLLSFVIYEKTAESKINYSWLVNMFYFLVFITSIYCVFQYLKLDEVWPIYKREESTWTMHGIWTATAYCSTFAALAFPIILLDTRKIKWVFLALDLWILVNAHASIAVLAVFVCFAVFLFFKARKFFIPVLMASAACGFFYIKMDFGDLSSLDQRFYIWDLTIKEIMKAPVFGHGFSAFYQFGFENIFVTGPAKGSFFPEAHNEFLNSAFEMGAIGLFLVLIVCGHIVYMTFKGRDDGRVLAIGLSLISFMVIALVQPVLHAPNTAVLGIVLFGALQNFYNRRNYVDQIQWTETSKESGLEDARLGDEDVCI